MTEENLSIKAPVSMDLSEYSLYEALIHLKFDLAKDDKYLLIIGRNNISELIRINMGYKLFDIEVDVRDGYVDEWMLINQTTRTAFYSEGA